MAYADDGDFIKEDVFDGIPCEFCNQIFPFEEIVIHESGCEYDFARVTETRSEEDIAKKEKKSEIQKEDLQMDEEEFNKLVDILIETELSDQKTEPPVSKKATTLKEEIPKIKKPIKHNFQDFEVLEDHLQENESFTFASGKTKKKPIEKEKPSFKKPVNLSSSNDMKCHIQNDIPDSDIEEDESLEKFWKRAEIKLAQRLRAMEKRKQLSMA